jgi:hypothetical protein
MLMSSGNQFGVAALLAISATLGLLPDTQIGASHPFGYLLGGRNVWPPPIPLSLAGAQSRDR